MKALMGLTAGIFLGYVFQFSVDEKISAVIILAAADLICGGISARFRPRG